jgi:hypothetical protein
MCTKEAYSTARIEIYVTDGFPIQNGLKQEDALSPLLFTFSLEYGFKVILGGPLVTTAWRVLGLRMEGSCEYNKQRRTKDSVAPQLRSWAWA